MSRVKNNNHKLSKIHRRQLQKGQGPENKIDGKEAEEKREKQLRAYDEGFWELNDSLRKNNICLTEFPEHVERERGESMFEQIIAENVSNHGKETGIQIQQIERTSPQINKNRSTP